ncbi:UPF0335 protein [Nymphon striatum]|nr:UPF0335 protein [Nymphon striatum]
MLALILPNLITRLRIRGCPTNSLNLRTHPPLTSNELPSPEAARWPSNAFGLSLTEAEHRTSIDLPDWSAVLSPGRVGQKRRVSGSFGPQHFENVMIENASDATYRVTADELRQFIERIERLDMEKKDLADQQKEVMAEAKSRGYDTKVIRKVIALRKREPDDIAEEEAVLEMYKEALGMG